MVLDRSRSCLLSCLAFKVQALKARNIPALAIVAYVVKDHIRASVTRGSRGGMVVTVCQFDLANLRRLQKLAASSGFR